MHPPFVHEMFRAVAEQQPDSMAIESSAGCVTYRELNRKCLAIAELLASAGIRKTDLIAIFAENRQLLIESILGVLQCRGAFISLSPGTPTLRLESMLAQCCPKLALVESQFVESFQPIAKCCLLRVIS